MQQLINAHLKGAGRGQLHYTIYMAVIANSNCGTSSWHGSLFELDEVEVTLFGNRVTTTIENDHFEFAYSLGSEFSMRPKCGNWILHMLKSWAPSPLEVCINFWLLHIFG